MQHILHRYVFFTVLVALFAVLSSCSQQRSEVPAVLVFSKTAGYTHASIPDGIAAIQELGNKHNFRVDTTKNAEMFTEENLKNYSAVIFLSTTGNVLDKYQEAAFERYIQSGGGFVGIHAASDTEYHWGWYGKMVGGYFRDHPGINDPYPNVQPGVLHVEDTTHSTTSFLPTQWNRTDEWYSFKNFNEQVNVLLRIDEDSYNGGAQMGYHPMAWYHEYDGGRVFYTALGHTKESFKEELFLNHVLKGIEYAIGENRRPDFSKVTTEKVPDANRFSKNMLIKGKLFEPIAMTLLPNRDVLMVQRRGEILRYNHSDSSLVPAGKLDVYWKTNNPDVNSEDGLLGIKADPNFEQNKFLYIYYSPIDTAVNRLSRFIYEDNNVQMSSEKVVLDVKTQREICCHTGGSIAFDNDGLLYLSTGDNTTPFDQKDSRYTLGGYAPLDERDGLRQYNALRSSGNANDLRGKILRIKINDDGSYDIPEGNLYPENQEGTRPEIYVQGNRNPYAISIDHKTGYLYWGEIGPDANNDSMQTKGPRGYDEINQAREAGFYGWPMFIGPNIPYRRYNYATGTSGKAFNPEQPINDSRYNTGRKELPNPEPAFIWYPYAESPEFPEVGSGGRNAMAGPVYYTDRYPEDSRLPEYFNGKLLIYDWVRGWIKVVTMWPNGDFSKIDSFMSETDFNSVIDMEVGPEGRIYLLEYGNGWYAQNEDAGLSYISYTSGNRAPAIQELQADQVTGLLPHEVTVSVSAQDPEDDPITYIWDMGDGNQKTTIEPRVTHTYKDIGEFNVVGEAQDTEGKKSRSRTLTIYAGNEAPELTIKVDGNRSFYFPGKSIRYDVSVTDEGEQIGSEQLGSLVVSADYIHGSDLAQASQGHQILTAVARGENLIQTLNCQSCHKIASESVAPSYLSIAEHYVDSSQAGNHLTNVIINGGSGRWGNKPMPAHINLSEKDAESIVSFIQSLPDNESGPSSLPSSGTLDPTQGQKPTTDGVLIINASYTDSGDDNIKPLTGKTTLYLRNNTIDLGQANSLNGFSSMSFGGTNLLTVPQEKGSFRIADADLTDIKAIQMITASQVATNGEYRFEARIGSPDGPIIGTAMLDSESRPGPQEGIFIRPFMISLDQSSFSTEEFHDIYFVSSPQGGTDQIFLTSMTFVPR